MMPMPAWSADLQMQPVYEVYGARSEGTSLLLLAAACACSMSRSGRAPDKKGTHFRSSLLIRSQQRQALRKCNTRLGCLVEWYCPGRGQAFPDFPLQNASSSIRKQSCAPTCSDIPRLVCRRACFDASATATASRRPVAGGSLPWPPRPTELQSWRPCHCGTSRRPAPSTEPIIQLSMSLGAGAQHQA